MQINRILGVCWGFFICAVIYICLRLSLRICMLKYPFVNAFVLLGESNPQPKVRHKKPPTGGFFMKLDTS